MAETLAPLNDDDLAALEQWLDRVPAPLEPLDLMMLDGYLVGVLLQPEAVPLGQWFPHVLDVDGRPVPRSFDSEPLRALVRRRHAELNRAIRDRQWFDPWVFEMDDDAEPLEVVMPWVAGFATAMELFPRLMNMDPEAVLEPLAVLYRAFDPDDLEEADDLLAMIEELEPPQDLAEAVEALVSSSLLLADVTRPAPAPARPGGAGRRPAAVGPRAPAREGRRTGGPAAPRGGPGTKGRGPGGGSGGGAGGAGRGPRGGGAPR